MIKIKKEDKIRKKQVMFQYCQAGMRASARQACPQGKPVCKVTPVCKALHASQGRWQCGGGKFPQLIPILFKKKPNQNI